MGKSFADDMEELLKKIREEIPKTFGSEEYNKRKQDVMSEHQTKYQAALDALDKEASEKGLMVQVSSMGAAVVPMQDGKPLSREDFLTLPEEERQKIEVKDGSR